MRLGERTMEELRAMAEEIANALSSAAEDRCSPASYGYRVARGQALALADLLSEIGADPRSPYAPSRP